MEYLIHKRGTTWRAWFTLPELVSTYDRVSAGWVCGRQSGAFEVRLGSTNRVELTAPADDTAEWPLGVLNCAISYGIGVEAVETHNFEIYVSREVAYD